MSYPVAMVCPMTNLAWMLEHDGDVAAASEAIAGWLRVFGGQLPVHVKVFIEGEEETGAPSTIDLAVERAEAARQAFAEAFGVAPVEMGCGGSIPIVAEFAERSPGALVLVTAATDPNSRMHGIDESLDLSDLGKAALAETLLLNNLVC